MKFWAYLHQSGHIHVKRFWESETGRAAVEDAYDSPFVVDVLEPYEAIDRQAAEEKASERISARRVDIDA